MRLDEAICIPILIRSSAESERMVVRGFCGRGKVTRFI